MTIVSHAFAARTIASSTTFLSSFENLDRTQSARSQSAGFAPDSLMMWLTDFASYCPDYNVRMAMTPDETLGAFIREHAVLTYERIKE